MRVMPNPEQLAYLRSIGALGDHKPGASAIPEIRRAARNLAPPDRATAPRASAPARPVTAASGRSPDVRARVMPEAGYLRSAWQMLHRGARWILAGMVALMVATAATPLIAGDPFSLVQQPQSASGNLRDPMADVSASPIHQPLGPDDHPVENTNAYLQQLAVRASTRELGVLRREVTLLLRSSILSNILLGALWFGLAMYVVMRSRVAPMPALQQKPGADSKPAPTALAHEAPPPVGAVVTSPEIACSPWRRRTRRRPARRWRLGAASVTGHVREENQDCGAAFEVGSQQVLIVADGCGGVPLGRQAARLATRAAAMETIRDLASSFRPDSPPQEIARRAITAAAERLRVEGVRLGITGLHHGLRTTLVVVVAGRGTYGFSYIGDGGGFVVRRGGDVEPFLAPMKGAAPNQLVGSLGPTAHGEAVTGAIPRQPGDLLIIGTDGVFDRVDQGFCRTVLRSCIEHEGDLARAAEWILDQLAGQRDEVGYVCDDNLTLAIIGGGRRPKLGPGFWTRGAADNTVAAESAPAVSSAELRG